MSSFLSRQSMSGKVAVAFFVMGLAGDTPWAILLSVLVYFASLVKDSSSLAKKKARLREFVVDVAIGLNSNLLWLAAELKLSAKDSALYMITLVFLFFGVLACLEQVLPLRLVPVEEKHSVGH